MTQNFNRALALLLVLLLAIPTAALSETAADGIIVFEETPAASDDGDIDAVLEIEPETEEVGELPSEAIVLDDGPDGEGFDALFSGSPDKTMGNADAGNAGAGTAEDPFDQLATVGDASFAVSARAGAFPEGATLRVTAAEDAAVARAAEAAVGVEGAYTHRLYRIEVLDGANNVILPDFDVDVPRVRVTGLELPGDARVVLYDEYAQAAWEIDATVDADGEGVAFPLPDMTVYDILTVEANEEEPAPEGKAIETPAGQLTDDDPASSDTEEAAPSDGQGSAEDGNTADAMTDASQKPSPLGKVDQPEAGTEEVPSEERSDDRKDGEEGTDEGTSSGADAPHERFATPSATPEGKPFGGPTDESIASAEKPGEEPGAEESGAEESAEQPVGDTPSEKPETSSVSPGGEPASPEGKPFGGPTDDALAAGDTEKAASPDDQGSAEDGDTADAMTDASQKPSPLGKVDQPEAGTDEVPAEERSDDRKDGEEGTDEGTSSDADVSPDDDSTEGQTEEAASPDDPAEGESEEEAPADDPTPFLQSATVNGVVVTVSAAAGAFPAGAILSVKRVPTYRARQANEAIDEVREDDVNVAVSYTFDIKVIDPETSEELQPADGQPVEVSFALSEAANENLDTSVYHVTGERGELTAEALPVDVDAVGETVTATADGFSLYVVQFTYAERVYELEVNRVVPLTDILESLELSGEIGGATVSDASLFKAYQRDGMWVVESLRSFEGDQSMTVTLDGTPIDITVRSAIARSGLRGVQTISVRSDTTEWTDGNTYVVDQDVEIADRVTVTGSVKLQLNSGCTLTCHLGINVADDDSASLTIDSQDGDKGKLVVDMVKMNDNTLLKAGIGGGKKQNCGTVIVNGGTLEITGGPGGASIGGGGYGKGGTITINGGNVTCTGNTTAGGGAGIGGGYCGCAGTITINGGSVTAGGSGTGIWAGIGTGTPSLGGTSENAGTITINGGTVTASGGTSGDSMGPGIGGYEGINGAIVINGGSVTANGAGIGGAGDSMSITLDYTEQSRNGMSVTSAGYTTDVTLARGFERDSDNFFAPGIIDKPDRLAGTLVPCDAFNIVRDVNIPHGEVGCVNIKAKLGDTIQMDTYPSPGYSTCMATYAWTDRNGQAHTDKATLQSEKHYTFEMPAGDVLLSAVFLPPVDYVDAMGDEKGPVLCQPVTQAALSGGEDSVSGGWYAMTGSATFDTVEITGDVNLILVDDNVLTAKKGIAIPDGASLTLWGQATESGKLYAGTTDGSDTTCDTGASAVCGEGSLEINGGRTVAFGGEGGGAGIHVGEVTVKGGVVTVTGQGRAGLYGGTVHVTGGELTAVGQDGGAGIDGETIALEGGQITARGSAALSGGGASAGIGSESSNVTLDYTDATVDTMFVEADSYAGSVTLIHSFRNGDAPIQPGKVEDNSTLANTKLIPFGNGFIINVVADTDHGRVTVQSRADAGETVKLTVKPIATKYSLDELRIEKYNGHDPVPCESAGKNKYRFTMPDTDVTIYATFNLKVDYVDANGADKGTVVCLPVTKITTELKADGTKGGWYAVPKNAAVEEAFVRVTGGDVNLILCDGEKLKILKGIEIDTGASLTVWGQSKGTGTLFVGTDDGETCTNEQYCAGIGGDYSQYGNGGTLTVNGGNIVAMGGQGGAGIGGRYKSDGGNVTINGGAVTAVGGHGASAIGRGRDGNNDGELSLYDTALVYDSETATEPVVFDDRVSSARGNYARIVRCKHPADQIIFKSISAAQHEFFCSYCNQDIVAGHELGDDHVCSFCHYAVVEYVDGDGDKQGPVACRPISDVSKNRYWKDDDPLTPGWYAATGNDGVESYMRVAVYAQEAVNIVLCDGTTLEIPAGLDVMNGELVLWGQAEQSGTLYAGTKADGVYSCDPDCSAIAGNVVVNSGTVVAIGGSYGGAGISGDYIGDYGALTEGSVTVNGGTVTSTGRDGGAGIGGVKGRPGGTIRINGGTVTATGIPNDTGDTCGAGIGGGSGCAGGTIEIYGGTVVATGNNGGQGDTGGAGIGGGKGNGSAVITIRNANVRADGYVYAPGIGGSDADVTIDGDAVISSSGRYAIEYAQPQGGDPKLNLYSNALVSVSEREGYEKPVLAGERAEKIRSWTYAKVEPCKNHALGSVTEVTGEYHKASCKYCATEYKTPHNTVDDICAICHATMAGYIDADGNKHEPVLCLAVADDSNWSQQELTGGWYCLGGLGVPQSRVEVTGDVNLILRDDVEQSVLKGIHVPQGASLTFWGQAEGTGKLYAGTVLDQTTSCDGDLAGIGGNKDEACGSITVYGGKVTARGGANAAGIGGGSGGGGGEITVKGGKVKGTGGSDAAGIGDGSGGGGGEITIDGGSVTAGSIGGATVGVSGGSVMAGGITGSAIIIGGGVAEITGCIGSDSGKVTLTYTADTRQGMSVTADTYAGSVKLEHGFRDRDADPKALFRDAIADNGTLANTTLIPADVYRITVSTTTNGVIGADRALAEEGDTVALTVTPVTGYEPVRVWVACGAEETDVEPGENGAYAFKMPAKDVTVNAEFGLAVYDIGLVIGGGSATVVQKSAFNRRIDITGIAADEGFELDSVSCVGADGAQVAVQGDADQGFWFTMPPRNVTLTVRFTAPVWVGGRQVDGAHLNDVMRDGSGSVSYDPARHALTINGEGLTLRNTHQYGSTEQDSAVICTTQAQGLVIKAPYGLRVEDGYAGKGIYASGPLTIEGDIFVNVPNTGILVDQGDVGICGGVDIHTKVSYGICVYNNGSVTVDSGAKDIRIESGSAGISGGDVSLTYRSCHLTTTGQYSTGVMCESLALGGGECVIKSEENSSSATNIGRTILLRSGTFEVSGTWYGLSADGGIGIEDGVDRVTASGGTQAIRSTSSSANPLGLGRKLVIVEPAGAAFSNWCLRDKDGNAATRAVIERRRVIVTFDANSPEATGSMDEQVVERDVSTPLTANAFQWINHAFAGWNTRADGSGKAYADGAAVKPTDDSDITLYAQWKVRLDDNPAIKVAIPAQTYACAALVPGVTVTQNGRALSEGRDYTVRAHADFVNVGRYTVTVDGKGGYTGAATGVFVINKKALSVTADAQSKTYGDADPALTYKVTGLVNGDALTGALARNKGENVGSYAITQGTLKATDNYNLTYRGAKLTINKRALTVTADAQSKTYGDADPELTAKVIGLVGSDTVLYTLSRAAGENAGEYAITPKGKATQGNYSVTYETGKLTIGRRALTVTAKAKSKVYGEDDPPLTYKVTGLVGKDKLTGKLARDKGEKVGSYAITQGTLKASDNYELTFKGAKLTIKSVPADPDYTLLATMKTSGKTALKLSWTEVDGADGYDVFFRKCGKGKYRLIATVGRSTRSRRIKGLKKATKYKAYVKAWRKVKGKKTYIGKASPSVHVITGGYTKRYANARKVTVQSPKRTLRLGKYTSAGAGAKPVKSGRAVLAHVNRLRYYSSDRNIATVSKTGLIKAKGIGSCTIYAVANNGVCAGIKVTVKAR